MIEVGMGKSRVSSGILKSYKFYDCVGAVAMSGTSGFLGHVRFDMSQKELEGMFEDYLHFFPRHSNEEARGLVLGGLPRVVTMVEQYMQWLGVNILDVKTTERNAQGLWPRRDIHFMPSERVVHYGQADVGVREYLL